MIPIKFTIDGKTHEVGPLKLKHYYIIQDIVMNEDMESKIEMVASISECPIEELKLLDVRQFRKLWDAIVVNRFTQEEIRPFHRVIDLFDADGKPHPYGFTNLDKMTLGEFADLDTISNDDSREKRLHEMMAILYRPMTQWNKKVTYYEIEAYDGEACRNRSVEFLELPLDVVHGAIGFFLSIARGCIEHTVASLVKKSKSKTEKEMLKEVLTLTKQLDPGSILSNSWQEEMSSSLMKLQDLALESVSAMHPTSKTKIEKKNSKLKNIVSKIFTTTKRSS